MPAMELAALRSLNTLQKALLPMEGRAHICRPERIEDDTGLSNRIHVPRELIERHLWQ
jgi:hypothetical protein